MMSTFINLSPCYQNAHTVHMAGTIDRAQRKLKWKKIRALSADRAVVEEEPWLGS